MAVQRSSPSTSAALMRPIVTKRPDPLRRTGTRSTHRSGAGPATPRDHAGEAAGSACWYRAARPCRRSQSGIERGVEVVAEGCPIEQGQPAPPRQEHRSVCPARPQRPQLGDRSAAPGHDQPLACRDAIDDVAAVVAQLPDRHLSHERKVSHVRHERARDEESRQHSSSSCLTPCRFGRGPRKQTGRRGSATSRRRRTARLRPV